MSTTRDFCGIDGFGPLRPGRGGDGRVDFTACFEYAILFMLPLAFLWTFGVCRARALLRRSRRLARPGEYWNATRGPLYVAKMSVALAMTALFAVWTSGVNDFSTIGAEVLFTRAALVTQFVVLFLVHLEHRFHRVSSSVLVVYWLLLLAAAGVRLQSLVVEHHDAEPQVPLLATVIALALCSIALEHMDKNRAGYVRPGESLNPCPETRAHFFSMISFSWLNGIMRLGYGKPLVEEDLWDVKAEDDARFVSDEFQREWGSEMMGGRPSLVRALYRTVGGPFLFAALFKLGQDTLQFVQPQLLRLLILFIANRNARQDLPADKLLAASVGYYIALAMFSAAVVQSVLLHQYFHRCLVAGMRLRAALVTAIYKKALRLSNASRQKSTVGEIVNHMSVDAQRLMDLCGYLHILWSGPFQIAVALIFLYREMGPSIFAGVAVMLLMIPVNAKLAIKQRALQKLQMTNKDGRMKLIDEILSGIKVIKLYAWESAFCDKVNTVRGRELKNLKSIGYLSAAQSMTWSCTPFLVSFATFSLYALIGDEPLNPQKIFVSLSLFNLLQFPLNMFPNVISSVVEATVSLKRIYAFLTADELPEGVVNNHTVVDPSVKWSITIRNASFRWMPSSSAPLILHNINFQLKRGALVAVVGRVGSSKSSLISAILGEMYPAAARQSPIHVYGRIAYVGQQAWIVNETLRENILFGRDFDAKLYQRTIDACALLPDIEMLPAGDLTQIGERGISLSGGQKARLSLARAVYAQADVYLLDDPLSAVDAHVGRHIFEHVIGKQGMLAGKSRLFVTHGIQYLPECDEAMMLRDGLVAEGPATFAELMAMGEEGQVRRLVQDFLVEHSDEAEVVDTLAAVVVPNNADASSHGRSSERSIKSSSSHGTLATKKMDGSSSIAAFGNASADTLAAAKREADGRIIVKEESAKGAVKWDVYLAYARSCSLKAAGAAVATLILAQAFNAGSNVWLEHWGSTAEEKRMSISVYLGIYGAFGFSFATLVVLTVVLVWTVCAVTASRILQQTLLESVMRSPMSFFDTTPLGRIVNRFSKDIYTVDEVLPRSFLGYCRTLLNVMTVLIIITASTPLFITFIIPMGFMYFIIQRYYIATSRELKRLDSTSRSPMYAHFSETLGGTTTIRAYAQVPRFEEENADRLNANQRAYYPSIASNRWLAMRLEFLGALVIFGAALFAVVGVLWFENVSAGVAGLSVSYALMVTNTLNWMVRQSCEIETNIVSVERIKEYVELPSEAPSTIESHRPPPSWPHTGSIEFRSYATRYREGLDLVLRDVSFRVEGGERIGVVGRTGSGKSSLMLGLFRILEPVDGSIWIDGVDIRSIGLHDLRSRITIIPQDPILFGGTIRFNLDPFSTHTDAQLWRALDHAHLRQKVTAMEGGLDAHVLTNGENFSVGERQLMCLARAVLRRSKVLVLDEATAAVDVETDALIQTTIREEFSESTVLTIAHRINTVMDSSRIMVMAKGGVVEMDRPDVLLRDVRSAFYALAKEAGQV